jgi:Mn-dependent DtxR family transcriptional regulator
VGLLKAGNYITMEEDGEIRLTDSGREVAEKILSRHTLLTELLVRLGVDREVASADACKMEHVISDESLAALKKFIES